MCVVGSWNEWRKTRNLFSSLTLSRDFWNCLSTFYAHWVSAKYQNNARYIWGVWKINEAPPLHGCVPFLFYPQEYTAAKLCLQTARAVTCKQCFFQKLPLFKNLWFYIFPCTVVILPNIYKCFCLLCKNWSYSSLKQKHSLIQWNPSGPKQCHIIRLYLWGDKNEENNF